MAASHCCRAYPHGRHSKRCALPPPVSRNRAAKVRLIARGSNLSANMSRYVVNRIQGLSNVEVLTETEIVRLDGKDGELHFSDIAAWGKDTQQPARHLFLFIGADLSRRWRPPILGANPYSSSRAPRLSGADSLRPAAGYICDRRRKSGLSQTSGSRCRGRGRRCRGSPRLSRSER
jgi:hypothetical protein